MMLSSDHVLQAEEKKGKKDKQDSIGYVQLSTVTAVIRHWCNNRMRIEGFEIQRAK